MKQHNILSENSEHHWPFLNIEGKVLLDLGCGRHGTGDLYQSSAVYLGEKGAMKVIAIDGRESEIQYFNENNPNPDKYTFISMFINTPDEDTSVYDEEKTKQKIEDWTLEGYSISDFFTLSLNSISGFRDAFQEYTEKKNLTQS